MAISTHTYKPKVTYLTESCPICQIPFMYYYRNVRASEKARYTTEQIRSQFTCSRSCSGKLRVLNLPVEKQTKKINMPCALEGCENYRKVRATQFIREGKISSVYCGTECMHKARITLTDIERANHKKRYKTTYWKRVREKALARDKYTCQRCFRKYNKGDRDITVHHITAITKFKNYETLIIRETVIDRLDNIISLCTKCHGTVEKTNLDFIPKFSLYVPPIEVLDL